MNRRPVKSSHVASIGWEPHQEEAADGTLEIEFKSGFVYQYEDVPESVYLNLLGASSIGRFFDQNIDGTYQHRRIRG